MTGRSLRTLQPPYNLERQQCCLVALQLQSFEQGNGVRSKVMSERRRPSSRKNDLTSGPKTPEVSTAAGTKKWLGSKRAYLTFLPSIQKNTDDLQVAVIHQCEQWTTILEYFLINNLCKSVLNWNSKIFMCIKHLLCQLKHTLQSQHDSAWVL